MPENQNIEYKSKWRDEYLKWICGFANANGGVIFIGKDDNGNVIGVENSKKLLEDIPNKTRDILGILVDVNLCKTKEGDYIEINVDSYPNPINYKGQYHYRSGSTKQELKGSALDKFLLKKMGLRWESVVVPKASINDLKTATFDFYKKRGEKSNRLSESIRNESNQQLLENLKVLEGNTLRRSAVLLFHPNPDDFITGSFIKIGYFQNEVDLVFQDEINGNLIEQIEKTIDLLFTKYIKAIVSYEGIHRIETYEYPKEAIREAILNAIAHKDYSGFTPIQVRVYDDKIMIWNQCHLPENWTIDKLLKSHSSRPHNPDIANALFRGGYIESWGRGISKMTELCKKHNQPKPIFDVDGSDFWVTFKKDIYNEEQLKEIGLNNRQINGTLYANKNGEITNKIYQNINAISKRTATNDLTELVNRFKVLKRVGSAGAGVSYVIIGQ